MSYSDHSVQRYFQVKRVYCVSAQLQLEAPVPIETGSVRNLRSWLRIGSSSLKNKIFFIAISA